ncbi:MAG: dipeptidase [Phycisphaeraceae bacterium]
MTQAVLKHLESDRDAALARLKSLLAIPSVSTNPDNKGDIERAARWVADALGQAGLIARVMPTKGHPVVLATTPPESVENAQHAPRVMFYGHYDVQPPEPLEEWTTPPFEPTVRDGAIYARGASDDKGQVSCFLEALRAWHAVHGKFPVHVTVLIEGEEEMGSVSLPAFLREHRDELAADIVLISDTAMWDRDTPAITYGLRGLLYFDLQLHNANRDLHSGVYGGTLANPATILPQVLARLWDEKHRITIPGFYDDVLPVSEEERRRWDALGFKERKQFFDPIGVNTPFGEAGFTTLQRKWARPACDINGLYGGYGGPGAKTVIPSFAGAKVSFRLAANQKADAIGAAFEQWLRAQDVHGCRWKITHLGGCDAVVLPYDSPHIAAAVRAMETSAGRKPVLMREGATIPVVADFKNTLGADSLLVGFGLNDDRLHAPNEKFDLSCFELGCRTHAVLLAELAKV